MKINARIWLIVVAVGVVLGCGGGGSSVSEVPDPVMRFINASPNSTALDAFANEIQLGNNVPYLGSSANFLSMEPGEYDIISQEDANPETQTIETFTTVKDTSLLAVAYGLVTPPNDEFDKRLRVATFSFDRNRPNGDQARLIVVHAYNAAFENFTPQVDFRNPGDNPQINLPAIDFGANRTVLVDAGPQTFVARRTGTEAEVTPQKTFTFQGGKIYAAIISGVEDAVGTQSPQINYIELQVK